MISLDDDSPSGEPASALSRSSSGGDQRLGNSSVSSQRSHGTTGSKADWGSRATHRSTPTRSDPGNLAGMYGVQALATDLEATPFGPKPPPGDPSLGTLSQDRSPRSGSKCPLDRPSSSDRSDRSATKRSVQQSPVNRPVHSEHSTGHRSLVTPVTPCTPGAPVRPSAPVKPGAPVTPGAPVNTGQKALEVQDTQLLDWSELLVLNSPVRPVQLEHNVHESFDLLNSDSQDDRADESPERSILHHSGHRSPGTGHTGHTGTGHTGHRSDREHSVHRSQ